MKRMSMLPWNLVVFVAVWPLAAAACQTALTPESAGDAGQENLMGRGASLFDSIDENLNPVSVADMIDGRPLVLAVGSCT